MIPSAVRVGYAVPVDIRAEFSELLADIEAEMESVLAERDGPILVGTWAAADWAIRFYERHGFELVPPQVGSELLETYWTIPERQIETSVVLAGPAPPEG